MPELPQRVEAADEHKGKQNRKRPDHHRPEGGGFQQRRNQQGQAHSDDCTSDSQNQSLSQEEPYWLPVVASQAL